ncbi:WD40-repeat-containing domain protein [Xylogone sp. PMI_703]|nr:WD40-repeat-containing domain protein [Xylogone sp. PMI_703]
MDPPSRPQVRRRVPATQPNHVMGSLLKHEHEASPTPFTSTGASTKSAAEIRRPVSSHTVSINWDENDETLPRHTSRLQIELAECVETKTVTTTTTTKRSYPPLLIRHPLSLDKLDSKEYPLALKPIPQELCNFSYEVDGQLVDFSDNQARTPNNILTTTPEKSFSRSISSANDIKFKNEETGTDDIDTVELRLEDGKSPLSSHRRSPRVPPISTPKSPSSRSTKTRSFQPLRSGHKARPLSARGGRSMNQKSSGHLQDVAAPLATPDTSEIEATTTLQQSFVSASDPNNGDSFESISSTSEDAEQDTFASAVATPPIVDSDPETFDSANTASISTTARRSSLNAQNASLPSPGLSPTFAAAELHSHRFPGEDDEQDVNSGFQSSESQDTLDGEPMFRTIPKAARSGSRRTDRISSANNRATSLLNAQSMIETFESMPNDMKTFMMYQFLRRCPRKTLHVVADLVNPALKCDFLDQLPAELSLQILSFLDYKDLCRAAQVSKRWRSVIDSNETGWKELLDRDGYTLPMGELERAIQQGWGWQDPHGPDAFEQDLSVQRKIPSTDQDSTLPSSSKTENEVSRRARAATKRKRAPGSLSSERAKRRAVTHEFTSKAQDILAKYPYSSRFHKSEGPLTAANAAALAVPDPQLGLPSLRKLHLFKSLYRRHYMIRRGWTSKRIEPHHMAFPAHPTHVITCLQFDDDKILTGSDDTLIHVYDTKTGALRKKLEGHEGGVWALQYEGNVLVSGSTDRSVRVWDIEKGLCTQVFHGHTSTVRCLQILMPTDTGRIEKGKPVMIPEKPLIITGSRDSQLRVWRLPEQGSKRYIQTGPPANDADCPYFVRVLTGHSHSVRAIAAHQDTLVSGSYDNTVRVWKISTGETVHRLQGHTMKVYSVVLDHKRNRCISGSMDNFVKIWSLETGACLFTLEGHSSLVGLLDLRDERLVSAAADSTLRIWDPENGQCKSTLSAHTGAITCFQHDGQKVISGSDRTLKMWDVKTGECIKDLLTDLSGVWQVKFDERRCVAAVQRDNFTFVEVLDFGASRDGVPASQRGTRILLSDEEVDNSRVVEEDD